MGSVLCKKTTVNDEEEMINRVVWVAHPIGCNLDVIVYDNKLAAQRKVDEWRSGNVTQCEEFYSVKIKSD